MSLSSKITILKNQIKSVADKIRSIDGSSEAIKPSEMPEKIQAIADSKREIEAKDYNFFDWDGKLLYAYSADEINALTKLPPMPSKQGLIPKEWNYTLAQLQTLATLRLPYPANVGIIYSAPDGVSTIIDVVIPEGDTFRDFTIEWQERTLRDVIIDWGDGTSETIEAAWNVAINHIYSTSGKYRIMLTPQDNTVDVINIPTDGSFCGANNRQKAYVKSVVVGKCYQAVGQGNGGRWFQNLVNLETVALAYQNNTALPRYILDKTGSLKALHIPSWVTHLSQRTVAASGVSVVTTPYNCVSIESEAFMGDVNLKFFTFPYCLAAISNRIIAYSSVQDIILPPNVTSVTASTFTTNFTVRKIILPNNLTTIPNSLFSINTTGTAGGYIIPYVQIPSTIETIVAGAFNNRLIQVMDLRGRSTMPTLDNVNAVNLVEMFVVDDEAYEAAITATNWATYAAKIVKASEYID